MWKDHIKSCSSDSHSMSVTFRWHLQIFNSWVCLWLLVQSILYPSAAWMVNYILEPVGVHVLHRSEFLGQQIWPAQESASGKITPEVLWGQPHTVHFQVMLALLAKPTWVEGLVLKLELGLESPGGLMKTWTIELHPQSFCFSGNLHSDRFPGDVHAAGPGITLDKLLVGSAWIRPLEVKKKWGFSIQENFSRSSVSCVPLICKPKAEVSLYSVPPGTWIATLPHELLSILWCP